MREKFEHMIVDTVSHISSILSKNLYDASAHCTQDFNSHLIQFYQPMTQVGRVNAYIAAGVLSCPEKPRPLHCTKLVF